MSAAKGHGRVEPIHGWVVLSMKNQSLCDITVCFSTVFHSGEAKYKQCRLINREAVVF